MRVLKDKTMPLLYQLNYNIFHPKVLLTFRQRTERRNEGKQRIDRSLSSCQNINVFYGSLQLFHPEITRVINY